MPAAPATLVKGVVLTTAMANETRNAMVSVFLMPTLFESFFFGVVMFSGILECVTETEDTT